MSIKTNLQLINNTLPEHVKLVAVSKFHNETAICEAYDAGQRIFGESKAQELQQKAAVLPTAIEWHFIGHLQTNKVKTIAPFISLIHSIDSYKLLEEVNRQAVKNSRIIPCLLQIHIAEEETKFGFDFEECRKMLASPEVSLLKNISIYGLMGMATNTGDELQIREEFRRLHHFFMEIKNDFFSTVETFRELSMGMSDDYPLAIAEGSTMVRIGSRIFGARYE
ncbi:MAG: YggS family pyridoxal phosphate-dependent enzyme [Bacteroidales bacterium]|jgi:pyridoxal phosphate enzyme (YggS family)|nr:YggS family pyridoxal phosphate-dependent enzyme [Bacteroidales bacterium]